MNTNMENCIIIINFNSTLVLCQYLIIISNNDLQISFKKINWCRRSTNSMYLLLIRVYNIEVHFTNFKAVFLNLVKKYYWTNNDQQNMNALQVQNE